MDFPRVSEHISFLEATKSEAAIRHGLTNIPDDETFSRMKLVAQMIFEPLRIWHGKPVGISSFFRSKAVNLIIGGAENSQHVTGEAIDIDADIYQNGITNSDIFNYIADNLDYDQLIAEGENTDGTPAWVHASYRTSPENRRQKLRIVFKNGKRITSVL